MKNFAMDFHAAHKGNCAQAVAAAWADAHGNSPELVERFKPCGGGHAEGGLCGALYAAMQLRPADKNAILEAFQKIAQGTLCSEIRPLRHMTCTERVGLAAEILDRLEGSK